MVTAAEQSAENLTGAFILILVIIAISFLAGYGLCFMRMTKRVIRTETRTATSGTYPRQNETSAS